jgi:hypothetical protein
MIRLQAGASIPFPADAPVVRSAMRPNNAAQEGDAKSFQLTVRNQSREQYTRGPKHLNLWFHKKSTPVETATWRNENGVAETREEKGVSMLYSTMELARLCLHLHKKGAVTTGAEQRVGK